MKDDVAISKTLSLGLRHDPAVLGVDLDPEGWADLAAVAAAVSTRLRRPIGIDDLVRVVAESPKKRFESDGVSIRAAYGHSIVTRIDRAVAQEVPVVLYHATAPAVLAAILTQGLRPMARQYVHLAVDPDTALLVGRRKTRTPVLLRVDTRALIESGFPLYEAGPAIFLADRIPPQFLTQAPG